MRPRTRFSVAVAALVVFASWRVWAIAQPEIPIRTADGGGGRSAGGDFVLWGTAGQPDAGRLVGTGTGSNLELRGGFWGGAVDRLVGVEGPPEAIRHDLSAPVPNPFNPRTTVDFALASETHVRLDIHDVRGRRVRTLVDEVRPAGQHSLVWSGRGDDGHAVASGVYYLRLTADGQVRTQKMTLLK